MKKLILLLVFCLCLNGVPAMAEGGEQTEQAASEVSEDSQLAAQKAAEEEALRQKAEEEAAEEEAARQRAEEEAAQRAAEEEAARQRAEEEAAQRAAEEEAALQNTEAVGAQEQPQNPDSQPEPSDSQQDEPPVQEATAVEPGQPSEDAETVQAETPADSEPAQPEPASPEAVQPEQSPEGAGPAQPEQPSPDAETAQPAEDPAGMPQPSESEQPQPETPQAEATPEQAEENTGEATEPVQEQPTPVPELPADAEAWFERDGVRLGGTLEEAVALLVGGEKVYVRSREILTLRSAPLRLLSEIELLADGEVFRDGQFAVRVSADNPGSMEAPALVELKDFAQRDPEERAELYVWVEASIQPTEEPQAMETPQPTAEPTPVLTVTAANYVGASWGNVPPEFTLSGIPEGKRWSYAAIIYDERIIPLSGNVYIPQEEGVYAVRFAMLDEIGDIVSASELYTMWLDWTAPEQVVIWADEEADYRLNISARDGASGVAAVSLNGGKRWHRMGDDETYVYEGRKERGFPEGEIQVRDAAGNIAYSDREYTAVKVKREDDNGGGGGGGYGGGGSGGDGVPAKTHAQGDGEEGVEYDALTLELPEEPMRQLTVGGEPMDLTLTLESAQEPGAPVGEDQAFSASLVRWSPTEADEEPDTLVLDAELDANLGDQFTYQWRFNGEVYRLLANSGIRYVALRVGDDVCAFPTEGFTGGTKYTELKMLGVSTRKFDYSLAMKVNLDPGYVSAMSDSDYSRECDLSIRAEVENMAYELSSSTASIMYFYNVYLGPEDMLNQPFGEYQAKGE